MGGSPNCCCESGMSLVMSSVWRTSEPAAADVWTPSIGTSFAFLMNLIILNFICILVFVDSFFDYSLSLSLSCLDRDFDRSTG